MDNFLLRLKRDMTAGWCPAGAAERVMHGTLVDAGQAAAAQRVTVLVPTDAVALLTARIPTRQRQRLRQALPYALEEQLAADVETLHFAAGRGSGDNVPCAVIDRELLRGWLGALEDAGIKPERMLPDVLALPRSAGEWIVLAEADGILLRHSEHRGLACDAATLPHLLPLLLQQQGDAPTRLRLYAAGADDSVRETVQPWCDAQNIELQHHVLNGDALTLLATQPLPADALNLLQGEFSRREQTRQLWRPWRAAAALLLALLLLQGGMAGARYLELSREDQRLAGQIEQVYRDAFPEAQRVVNAPVQMEQKLAELRRGSGGQELHRLLLHAAPKLRDSGVSLRALNYNPGVLDIELNAPDLQTLDRFKQALDSGPLRAEIAAADSSGGAVAGRITLRGAGK